MYISTTGSLREKLDGEFAGQGRMWGDTLALQSPFRTRPFNHAAFYEVRRNNSALALSKAYNNETRTGIWSDKNLMRAAYDQYLDGQLSEEEFKQMMECYNSHVEMLLEQDLSIANV